MLKLSIIIPTFNESKHIVNLLNYLQYLRNCKHEIILVDAKTNDAKSCDTTIKLASPLVDSVLFSKKGRAIQQNMGAKIATGDYLLFLHADTHLPKEFIQEIENCDQLIKNQWGRFDVKLSGSHNGLRIIEFMMNLRSRLTGIATGDQAIFVNRSIFESIGGFSAINLMEDIDLSSRLMKISKPYCSKLKVTTSSKRWENNGLIKTIVTMWWYRLQYFWGVDSKILEKKYYG